MLQANCPCPGTSSQIGAICPNKSLSSRRSCEMLIPIWICRSFQAGCHELADAWGKTIL